MTRKVIYPLLPLRDIVVFPGIVVPLFVGRVKSINALDAAIANSRKVVLATQKDSSKEEPSKFDLYSVGVLANILQIMKLPDGTIKVIVEGDKRVRILNYVEEDDKFQVQIDFLDDNIPKQREASALCKVLLDSFKKLY